MINPKLHELLEKAGWNPTTIALHPIVMSARSHVTETLNNKRGRGKHTRKRIVTMFKAEVPDGLRAELLKELGWNEDGSLRPLEMEGASVATATFHVEHTMKGTQ